MDTSQSRHFSLQWLDRPKAWLEKLDAFVPTETRAAWSWHVSHHQLLTLARRSDREPGLSILWFAVNRQSNLPGEPASTLLLGALLPDDRLAIIASSRAVPEYDELRHFLASRFKLLTIMGSEKSLRDFGVLPSLETVRVFERQTPWGKRLTTVGDGPTDFRRSQLARTRRAIETDRGLINRWARLFSGETYHAFNREDAANQTAIEAEAWMRRGRLLIFETDRPVGMAALSGEFDDRDFGRTCRLSLVFVDPIYRGRGIGHEIVRAIENEARLESAQALILYSDSSNDRASRFYSSLGFQVSDDWLEISAADGGFSGVRSDVVEVDGAATGSKVKTTG